MGYEADVNFYFCGESTKLVQAEDELKKIFSVYSSDAYTIRQNQYEEADANGIVELRQVITGNMGIFDFDDDDVKNELKDKFDNFRWCLSAFYTDCGEFSILASDYNSKKIKCFNSFDDNLYKSIRKVIGEYGIRIMKKLDWAEDVWIWINDNE